MQLIMTPQESFKNVLHANFDIKACAELTKNHRNNRIHKNEPDYLGEYYVMTFYVLLKHTT